MADETPTIEPGQSAQSIAAAITERLRPPATGDEGAPGADSPPSSPPPAQAGQGDDAAPADTQATGDDQAIDRPEPDPPPLEPPRSWSKEARQNWAKLDRDTQEYLRDRDSEDSAAVRRTQNEAAEKRKQAEAEIAQIAAERQRTAQQLEFLSQHIQNFDPILAEGARTDWTRLAKEAPAEYVAKWQEYGSRIQTINAINQQRHQLRQQSLQQDKARMVETLRQNLSLDDKAFAKFDAEVTGYLLKAGFRPEFIEQVVDPTSIQMAHKAMLYDKLMAERAALEAKKKAPTPTRTMRPGVLEEGNGSDARFEAAKKAALKSGNARTVASLIAQRLRATPQS
jgi:hypothetical protein